MFNNKIIEGIFFAIIPQLIGIQGEFIVILRDSLCPVHDTEYVTDPETYVDDNNGLFFNFTVIKMFPSTTEGYLRLIGASMGEYVVDTGLDVQMPYCEMLDEPVILGPILQMIGLDKNNCPPEPGVYGSESYTVPTSMFPEDFLPNQYKSAFEILNEGKQILVIEIYFDIQ